MESPLSTRPKLHFTPPSGWMNDPNGLVYFEEEWHLFYQYLPPQKDDKHWGHAVSRDLLAWEHLPIALFPDELGAIWSGSCVADTTNSSGFFADEEGGGLVALFTHHQEGQCAPQSQSLAYSSDKGRTWTKYDGNPVLRSTNSDFRDPKVSWHEPTKSWVMILAAGDQAEIYRSPDLKTWTFSSAFGKGLSEIVWECPDLFPLPNGKGGEVWILVISLLDRDNFQGKFVACEVHYLAGYFDGFSFVAETGLRRLSHGPDDYASVTFAHVPGGRQVLLGWLNHWGYSFYIGQMTLPRELHWCGGALVQTPATSIEQARSLCRKEIGDAGSGFSPIEIATVPWELVVQPNEKTWSIEVRKAGATIFTLTRNCERGVWCFQRAIASFPPEWKGKKEGLEVAFTVAHEAPLFSQSDQATRMIVDAVSVEVFCDGGLTYFSAQIFPPEGEWEIEGMLNTEC